MSNLMKNTLTKSKFRPGLITRPGRCLGKFSDPGIESRFSLDISDFSLVPIFLIIKTRNVFFFKIFLLFHIYTF